MTSHLLGGNYIKGHILLPKYSTYVHKQIYSEVHSLTHFWQSHAVVIKNIQTHSRSFFVVCCPFMSYLPKVRHAVQYIPFHPPNTPQSPSKKGEWGQNMVRRRKVEKISSIEVVGGGGSNFCSGSFLVPRRFRRGIHWRMKKYLLLYRTGGGGGDGYAQTRLFGSGVGLARRGKLFPDRHSRKKNPHYSI